jgi:hypothetical protein
MTQKTPTRTRPTPPRRARTHPASRSASPHVCPRPLRARTILTRAAGAGHPCARCGTALPPGAPRRCGACRALFRAYRALRVAGKPVPPGFLALRSAASPAPAGAAQGADKGAEHGVRRRRRRRQKVRRWLGAERRALMRGCAGRPPAACRAAVSDARAPGARARGGIGRLCARAGRVELRPTAYGHAGRRYICGHGSSWDGAFGHYE